MHQKLAPDPFLILLNNPKQPLQARNSFKIYGILKASKRFSQIFLLNPVPFNGKSFQKQKGSGNSHQLLFRSQNKFRKIYLFVIYYLTKFDDVM